MATLIDYLDFSLSQKDPLLPNETKRVILKEALQAHVLDFIYNHPEYRRLNFYGGTCLHIVYGLNRLSEDIDLDNSNRIPLDLFARDLNDFFQFKFGYPDLTVKTQQSSSDILRTTLRFPILNVLKLSAHANEALHLKIEISHHPQAAKIQRTPIIAYGRSFVPAHFSIESMMSAKMLACLERSFIQGRSGINIKGRDYYDLLWLMQRNILPYSLKLEKEGVEPYSIKTAMTKLKEKVAGIRSSDLALDLIPLFEQRSFIINWLEAFHENFNALADGYINRYLNKTGPI